MRYIIESGEIVRKAGHLGYIIKDSDLITLKDGRSWNPQFTVWCDRDYGAKEGDVVRVEATSYYEKESKWAAPDGEKTRREKTLSDVINMTVLARANKPDVPEEPLNVPEVQNDSEVPF